MKKIMFNDSFSLTEAVLSGRKTQTRRIVPQSVIEKYSMLEDPTIVDDARYDIGEIVAVAQKYEDIFDKSNCVNPYDWDDEMPKQSGWTNKMFVRADLMPHYIRIIDVRVERLQDISDEDCINELGLDYLSRNMGYGNAMSEWVYQFRWEDKSGRTQEYSNRNPKEVFAIMIDKICGIGIFESNPYVFVYEFELIK